MGQGARGCVEELTQVADLLGAGVAKALLGKDVLPDDLPWVTGSIGLLGTTASYKLMTGCDTLLTVGSNFPYSQFLPELDQARAIQIDRSGAWIGMRYPYELNLVGDAKASLQALIPLLRRKEDRSWRQDIESNVTQWWQALERLALTGADPVNPMRIFHELSQRLPANAMVAADSGSAANWYARHLRFHGDMRGSLSGTLASMGPGVPYVIGAKWAQPDRPAIALVGDGAMQMNGMAELITVAHYWQQWADPRLIVAVLHNNDLNKVTWEMRAMGGAPKFAESQTLPDVDYAAFARSLGLNGVNLDDPDAIGPAWQTALGADRPTVLDILCDPDVPPFPPHATFDQVKATAEAVLRGDEDAWGFVKQGIKQKAQQYLPGNKEGHCDRPQSLTVMCGRIAGQWPDPNAAVSSSGVVTGRSQTKPRQTYAAAPPATRGRSARSGIPGVSGIRVQSPARGRCCHGRRGAAPGPAARHRRRPPEGVLPPSPRPRQVSSLRNVGLERQDLRPPRRRLRPPPGGAWTRPVPSRSAAHRRGRRDRTARRCPLRCAVW